MTGGVGVPRFVTKSPVVRPVDFTFVVAGGAGRAGGSEGAAAGLPPESGSGIFESFIVFGGVSRPPAADPLSGVPGAGVGLTGEAAGLSGVPAPLALASGLGSAGVLALASGLAATSGAVGLALIVLDRWSSCNPFAASASSRK